MKQPQLKLVSKNINPVLDNMKYISKRLNLEYDILAEDVEEYTETSKGYSKRTKKVTSKRKFRQSLRNQGLSWENILAVCPFYENEREFPVSDREKKQYGSWSNPEASSGSTLSINICPGLFLQKMEVSNIKSERNDRSFTPKSNKYLVLVCASVYGPGIDMCYRMVYDISKNQITFNTLSDGKLYPIDLKRFNDQYSVLENMYRVWVGPSYIGLEYANDERPKFSDLINA